nr:MAG TPA: hypothetical protein [Caudoviricetes sp.]
MVTTSRCRISTAVISCLVAILSQIEPSAPAASIFSLKIAGIHFSDFCIAVQKRMPSVFIGLLAHLYVGELGKIVYQRSGFSVTGFGQFQKHGSCRRSCMTCLADLPVKNEGKTCLLKL